MYLVWSLEKNISAFCINIVCMLHFGLHLHDSVYMIVFCLHILGPLWPIGRHGRCIVKRDPLKTNTNPNQFYTI